jgi:hypothetical protein
VVVLEATHFKKTAEEKTSAVKKNLNLSVIRYSIFAVSYTRRGFLLGAGVKPPEKEASNHVVV